MVLSIRALLMIFISMGAFSPVFSDNNEGGNQEIAKSFSDSRLMVGLNFTPFSTIEDSPRPGRKDGERNQIALYQFGLRVEGYKVLHDSIYMGLGGEMHLKANVDGSTSGETISPLLAYFNFGHYGESLYYGGIGYGDINIRSDRNGSQESEGTFLLQVGTTSFFDSFFIDLKCRVYKTSDVRNARKHGDGSSYDYRAKMNSWVVVGVGVLF